MPSAVTSRKFSTMFDWFDQDRDGQLTQSDFAATAGVFSRAAREDDHTNIGAIRTAFDQWWQLLVKHGDTDGDGQVSREEFVTVMEDTVTTEAHFEPAVMAIADAVMSAVDTDQDGVLSLQEYVRLYDTLGVDRDVSTAAFHLVDRDGNGVISFAEYRAAIVEFYLSTDPAAPGNHLLGPAA
ncbi:EF-hand domain-containing protein [Streptomyces sp. NPDC059533]|uniref:EF-hand domain-containing protein n=1 Tax=unclassified Streptomyces TaxID=2593676 RepID=UPI00369A71E1